MRFRLTRWMFWMALAAGAMYFLDPVQGERRRAELRSRINSYRRAAERAGNDLASTG